MTKLNECPGCGAYWGAQSEVCHPNCVYQAGLRKEQDFFSGTTASQSQRNLAAGLVPPSELLSAFDPWFTPQQHPAQGGGLEGAKAEVEAEADEGGKFIVIKWYGYEPYDAIAELVEVRSKPNGTLLIRNLGILRKVSPLYPIEQVTDSLGRVSDGVMICLEPLPLEGLDKVNSGIVDPPRSARDKGYDLRRRAD